MTDYGRYVAIHLEATLGQDHFTGSIANFDYFDVLSEGFSEDNQMQVVEAVSRERRRFALGGFATSGDKQIAIDMNTIGRLLYGALGGAHLGGTAKNHLFYPSEDIPTFNVERGFGGTFTNNALRYIKSVVGTLSIECSAGSNPTATVSWNAAAKDSGFLTSAQTLANVQARWGINGATYDDEKVPGFHQVEMTIAAGTSVLTEVEALTIEIANNPDPVPRLGSRHINRNKVQARTVGGTMDVSFDDDDMYQRFLDGTTTSTAPGTSYTTFVMEVMVPYTAAYNWHIYFPAVAFKTPGGPNLSGADRKKMSIEWQAFVGDTSGVQVSNVTSPNNWRTNLPNSGQYDTEFDAADVPDLAECLMWLENDKTTVYSTQ